MSNMSTTAASADLPGPIHPIYVGPGCVVTISIAVSFPAASGGDPSASSSQPDLSVGVGSMDVLGAVDSGEDVAYRDPASDLVVQSPEPACPSVPLDQVPLMGVPGCSNGYLPEPYSGAASWDQVAPGQVQSNAAYNGFGYELSDDDDNISDYDEPECESIQEESSDDDSDVEFIEGPLEDEFPEVEIVLEYIIIDQ